MVYQKLGRQTDAQAVLERIKSSDGDDGAYHYVSIYAQWGDIPSALQWLEVALHRRDSGLSGLKADPELDPLRNEPRFQAIVRELKFPH